jgi:anti-sigma regulatory factor (Ser/Thr protein kinase)
MSDPSSALVLELSGGREAATLARHAVRAGDGTLPASVRYDLLLLMTEVVTNAVRHSNVGPGRSLRVELRWSARHVRVEVVDPGPGFRLDGPPTKGETGGWGLFLVDRIADRWGVSPAGPGSCVWFEIEF